MPQQAFSSPRRDIILPSTRRDRWDNVVDDAPYRSDANQPLSTLYQFNVSLLVAKGCRVTLLVLIRGAEFFTSLRLRVDGYDVCQNG